MQVTMNITWIFCSECGVLFGLTTGHAEQLQLSGDDFYCPNGHENSFCTDEDYEDDESDEAEPSEALTKAHAENRKAMSDLTHHLKLMYLTHH